MSIWGMTDIRARAIGDIRKKGVSRPSRPLFVDLEALAGFELLKRPPATPRPRPVAWTAEIWTRAPRNLDNKKSSTVAGTCPGPSPALRVGGSRAAEFS